MRQIILSRGLSCSVDDEDYDFLMQWKWTANGRPPRFYAHRRQRGTEGKSQLILMHRLILQTPPDMVTDHIDGNSLNNVRANLRIATQLQNMMNRHGKRNGTSSYKGVWLDRGPRNTKDWRSAIRLNGKLCYLGRFSTEEEAGAAYAKSAAQHFGEYHRTSMRETP